MRKFYQKNYKIKIRSNIKLSGLTTFKIGGCAKFFCQPKNKSEIKEAFRFAEKNDLKIFVIGGGSNILISDNGYDGLIISTKKLNEISINDMTVKAECGVLISTLNRRVSAMSLSGLEFSGGLPGSLGGACFMNARAYGGQFSDAIKSIHIIKHSGEELILSVDRLNYSYKDSIFMNNPDYFIYKITLRLEKGNKEKIEEQYKKIIADRIKKGQFKLNTAGCTFKNNHKLNIITGKLIEDMGLKGFKIGNARVYENHGNFIINNGKAKAGDVKKLIEYIEEKIYKEKGIRLVREVILVGFDD